MAVKRGPSAPYWMDSQAGFRVHIYIYAIGPALNRHRPHHQLDADTMSVTITPQHSTTKEDGMSCPAVLLDPGPLEDWVSAPRKPHGPSLFHRREIQGGVPDRPGFDPRGAIQAVRLERDPGAPTQGGPKRHPINVRLLEGGRSVNPRQQMRLGPTASPGSVSRAQII